MQSRVLVVEDDAEFRGLLCQRLCEDSLEVVEAQTGGEGLERHHGSVDLTLLDYVLPDADGLSVLRRMKAQDPEKPVIVMSAHSSVERAVQALKAGAYHYLTKPFLVADMLALIHDALDSLRIGGAHAEPQPGVDVSPGARLLGDSPAIAAVRSLLGRVARSPAPVVLITGETGTGKREAAGRIHEESGRSDKPFVALACSLSPESALEAELFGQEGANGETKGALERADGGTLFLDEIAELPASLQGRLLRFVESRSYTRRGGSAERSADVRVIAASSRDLGAEVRCRAFREDLLHRLEVVSVRLPSLRERAADIPSLVECFLRSFAREIRKEVSAIEPAVVQALAAYPWPGNVRELRNAIERAVLLAEHQVLTVEDFPLLVPARRTALFELPADGIDIEELSRDLVAQALERTGWNKTRAALLLGMNRDQIRYRIEKYGLTPPSSFRAKSDP